MLKLYQFPRSGNSRCVRIALEEKGVAFERVNVDFFKGDHKKPEFLKLNPFGTVPTIQLNGFSLHEVTAILEYLEDKFPEKPLLPADPEGRARVRLLTGYFDKKFTTSFGPLVVQYLLVAKDKRNLELIGKNKKELDEHVAHLDKALESGPYLAGEAFTVADCCYIPNLVAFGDVDYEIKPENARLLDWLERMKQRPSFGPSET